MIIIINLLLIICYSRWLRLLFGREFPLQDLLVLWDAIFADNKSFDLVNYIVVAMLVAIRNICEHFFSVFLNYQKIHVQC